jgi:hypothetical protein
MCRYIPSSNKCHLDKALFGILKEIFNELIWADNLNKEGHYDWIGSSSLRNRHTIRQIQVHLEKKFKKHRPVDIQSVMVYKFVMEVDTHIITTIGEILQTATTTPSASR